MINLESTDLVTASVLFISGVQRSGTTAIANLMSTHPEVRVCIERYKYLFGRDANLSEISLSLFTKKRILDFSDNYTNHVPEKSDRFRSFYDDLENDYEKLRYVGDKVPGSHHKMGILLERIPAAKIIFIVRDILEVSKSWDARANSANGSWPSFMNALQSVKHWNECNKEILELNARYPENICVVDYHKFFGESFEKFEESKRILCFLKLDESEKFNNEVLRSKRRFNKILAERPSTETEKDILIEIDKASNISDYNEVLEVSRSRNWT